MAHIRKLTDKSRTLPWRAQIRRKGQKVLVKMFASRREAEHWATEQERTLRLTGLPHTIEELKKHTFADLIRRYRDEITQTKGCRVSETTVLNKLLRHPIAAKSLAYISRQDAYTYRDDRLKETWKKKPIKPSTVRREINTVQHIFEIGREQWGYTNLTNPFRGLKIRGSMHRRKRRLKDGELERLERACEDCRELNRYYVPLAIYLAVETAMRLQEIFNLTWQDVDIKNRRIEIRQSKTDYLNEYPGRRIVLSIGAQAILITLEHSLQRNGRYKRTDKVFPMSKEAFKQSWTDVRRRAGITGLTFHDLRREAGSRFDEADLSKAQHQLMMGHGSKDITSLYIESDLKRIQDKLDRYALGGMTFAEAIEKVGAIRTVTRISDKPKVIPIEELGRGSMIKFENEAEMEKWVEQRRKQYKDPDFVRSLFPYPPRI